MLSLNDCIDFCGLTSDQVDAIAAYKHVPTIVAAEWAEEMLESEEGCAAVDFILAEEARHATERHLTCAAAWIRARNEFRRCHPEVTN